MAKWRVEQRKFDKAKGFWAGNGSWEVEGDSAEEALKYVFFNIIDKPEEFQEVISSASKELYGIAASKGQKSWSVRPAGSGAPG